MDYSTEDLFGKIIDRSTFGSAKWAMRTGEMKEKNIMPFSVADMELPTAPPVVDALRNGAEMGIYGYTRPDSPYRDAVTGWFKRRHGYEFDGADICCTNGVVNALYALVRTYSSPGDGIIVQPPVYYPFYSAIKGGGREIVKNPLVYSGGRYSMNLDELEALAKNPKNTMMIFCSPHNPVGRVWNVDELRSVADICQKNNVLLISDDIHCDLTKNRHTIISTLNPAYKNNVITCTSTAKTFNLAGFTSANIIIEDNDLRERFSNQLRSDGVGGTGYFARLGTIAAYTECDWWVDALNSFIESNYALLKAFVSNRPALHLVEKEGTYLTWLDMRSLNLSNEDLERFMNEKALMSIDPGHWFGDEGSGFVRINIAVPQTALVEALDRFGTALDNHMH